MATNIAYNPFILVRFELLWENLFYLHKTPQTHIFNIHLMIAIIEKIGNVRRFLLNQISDLSPEQLNEIPKGFNNNVIWNLAHLVVAQQSLCYLRAGQSVVIDERYMPLYKPGTKPEGLVDAYEIEKIKDMMLTTLDTLKVDYANGVFDNYPVSSIRYGEMASIDDALQYVLFHEGIHFGYIMALKKLL